MNFTISAVTKEGKKYLKQAIKAEGRSSGCGKKNKYRAVDLEKQLHTLGRVLEEAKQTEIELVITLIDEEGAVEKAGTSYVFESLIYRISEGYYPTLLDLIREDLFKETDENMSVEESFRNEKILEVLEKSLESEDQTTSLQASMTTKESKEPTEVAPWERPILPIENKKASEDLTMEESFSSDPSNDVEESLEEDEFEALTQDTLDEIPQTIEDVEDIELVAPTDPLAWTEEKIQAFLEPFFLEEAKKHQEEIKQQTFLEYIQAQFPPEETWMKEKQQLFLNELYLKIDLPQAYKVFVETQQELIAQSRGMLQEQLESVQSLNWNELAQEELMAFFEEKQEELDQEVNEYTIQQNQSWEKTKASLLEEEQRVIEEETRKIKEKYEKKREQSYTLIVERINQFVSENQESFVIEKNKLLQERMLALKQSYLDSLNNDKAKISQQLNEELNHVYQGTLQIVFEKHQKIQEALMQQLPEWKAERAKQQKIEDARLIAEQKEKQRQEELRTRQKETALREAELALKEKEMEQAKEEKKAARQERKEQHEVMLEQLRQAQLHPYMPKLQDSIQRNEPTKETPSSTISNGWMMWMVGCITSISLLIGGGSVAVFNHLHDDTQTSAITTESIQAEAKEQARKEYEQQIEVLLNRTNQSTTDSSMENSKEKESSKAKEGSSNSTVQSNSSESSESNEVK